MENVNRKNTILYKNTYFLSNSENLGLVEFDNHRSVEVV